MKVYKKVMVFELTLIWPIILQHQTRQPVTIALHHPVQWLTITSCRPGQWSTFTVLRRPGQCGVFFFFAMLLFRNCTIIKSASIWTTQCCPGRVTIIPRQPGQQSTLTMCGPGRPGMCRTYCSKASCDNKL